MLFRSLLLTGLYLVLLACQPAPPPPSQDETPRARAVMEAHLAAISAKDLAALAATLPPDSTFSLILPQEEIMDGSGAFLDFHQGWFAGGNWTFTTRILDFRTGPELANAVVEAMYREPERDGVPYFNRMIVTYLLRKYPDGAWYVVQDHASSSEKSTDAAEVE
ncbi:MAG: nuclear transport factor 2 family protein [Bacteroidota bacterium]